MEFTETVVYRGPNRWSSNPVIAIKVAKPNEFPARIDVFIGLVDRLQCTCGTKLRRLEPDCDSPHTIIIPIEYEEESLTAECIKTAKRMLDEDAWRMPEANTFEDRRLIDLADDIRLGPSSLAILEAASERGIPFHRLNRGSLVQLGEGRRQRRIWTAETDATSAIAEAIAGDKQLTRFLLDGIGINVPLGSLVTDAEDAWRTAQLIGLPVAVKPCGANHACGVSLDLQDRESILAAYEWAKTAGQTDKILVEQFIIGDHHRLLVVGDRMVAASRGQREYIVGDGRRSVRELVEEINRDPRRGENYTDLLGIIPLNEATGIVLSKQQHHFESIPFDGEQVLVKHVGDLIEDCTDLVHAETAATAVLAAKAVGLDIAGLDVVAQDISKPLGTQRGGIVEVNAGPSLSSHVKPLRGKPRPVGKAVIELLFPDNKPARIPIITIFSTTGTTAIAKELMVKALKNGALFGLYSRSQIAIGTKTLPPTSDPIRDVRGLLGHPELDGLVVEISVDESLARGCPVGRADIIVVLDEALATNDSLRQKAAYNNIAHVIGSNGTLMIGSSSHALKLGKFLKSQRPNLKLSESVTLNSDLLWSEVADRQCETNCRN
jgi:cyanophycin synthetase